MFPDNLLSGLFWQSLVCLLLFSDNSFYRLFFSGSFRWLLSSDSLFIGCSFLTVPLLTIFSDSSSSFIGCFSDSPPYTCPHHSDSLACVHCTAFVRQQLPFSRCSSKPRINALYHQILSALSDYRLHTITRISSDKGLSRRIHLSFHIQRQNLVPLCPWESTSCPLYSLSIGNL